MPPTILSLVFFFTHPATTELYTLSLHDALPISRWSTPVVSPARGWSSPRTTMSPRSTARWPSAPRTAPSWSPIRRSEEHTSELQSRRDLVCRLLLEKKKKKQQPHYHNEYK